MIIPTITTGVKNITVQERKKERKKSLLMAVIDEFYTSDLMEIRVKNLSQD